MLSLSTSPILASPRSLATWIVFWKYVFLAAYTVKPSYFVLCLASLSPPAKGSLALSNHKRASFLCLNFFIQAFCNGGVSSWVVLLMPFEPMDVKTMIAGNICRRNQSTDGGDIYSNPSFCSTQCWCWLLRARPLGPRCLMSPYTSTFLGLTTTFLILIFCQTFYQRTVTLREDHTRSTLLEHLASFCSVLVAANRAFICHRTYTLSVRLTARPPLSFCKTLHFVTHPLLKLTLCPLSFALTVPPPFAHFWTYSQITASLC